MKASPFISVIIPVYNAGETLPHCLAALSGSDYSSYETVVVDDSSSDESRAIAARFGATVVRLNGGPAGPAAARNKGAAVAKGDILFFVDADVVVEPDTVSKVAAAFLQAPDLAALFGSYDDRPAVADFLSQYKNLVHHYVHQQGNEEASTFWSGCGAIRRDLFMDLGGFDAQMYPRPSIEDITLGYSIRARHFRIHLNKSIQVKHLKRWTLRGLLKTDILDRAIPWTMLIHREKNLPNDLNLQTTQRISALLALALIGLLSGAVVELNVLFPVLTVVLFLLGVSRWSWLADREKRRLPGPAIELWVGAALLGALAGLQNQQALLIAAISAAVLDLGSYLLHRINPSPQPVLHYLTMLAFVVAMTLAVLAAPLWYVIPSAAFLAIICWLNRHLISFFIEQRGYLFAMGVVPYQLLYYCYSVAAFAAGTALHYRRLARA